MTTIRHSRLLFLTSTVTKIDFIFSQKRNRKKERTVGNRGVSGCSPDMPMYSMPRLSSVLTTPPTSIATALDADYTNRHGVFIDPVKPDEFFCIAMEDMLASHTAIDQIAGLSYEEVLQLADMAAGTNVRLFRFKNPVSFNCS